MAEQVVAPGVAPSQSATKNRWLTVTVLSTLQLIENSEGGLINSLFPVIRADLGLTLTSLGILTSIGKFARMIFGPIWAILGDRFGRKLILVLTALWGVWMVAAGFAQNFNQLVLLYGIGVLGTVAAEPISNGLVSDIFKPNERGKVYGTMRSVTGAGSIIMTPLLGQLAGIPDNQGWRIGMFIMGGISILGGLLTWAFVTDPKHEVSDEKFAQAVGGGQEAKQETKSEGGFRLADVPRLLAIPTVALLGFQLIFITSLILFAFQVTFLVDVRRFTTQEATLLTSVFFIGFTISSFMGGILGDRFARWNPRIGRVVMMQLYLVAFAVMSFLAMQVPWGSRAAEYVVWLVFGLVASLGFSGCVLPMVSQVVLPQYRGTAFALLFSFIQGALAAILSLALGGLAQQYGLQPVMFWLITVPYAINAVFWFVFYRTFPRDQERMQQQLAAQSAAAGD